MSNTPTTTTTTSQTSRDNISHSTTSPETSKDEKDMKTKINTKAESEESSAAATLGSMGTAREHLHAQYQPSPPGPIPSHLTSSFGGTAHHTQPQGPPPSTQYGYSQPIQQLHPIQQYPVLNQASSQPQPQPQPQASSPSPIPAVTHSPVTTSTTHTPDQNGASKQRMRVVKACDRCRSHKIKCSGECPCATCLKQAKECTFSNKVFQKRTKGLELPEPKRAKYAEPFGLPEVKKDDQQEYINHLENRVHYLESLLTNTSTDTFKTPLSNEPESEFVTETLFCTSSKWRFSRRHQNLLIAELCRSMYSNLSEELKQLVTLPRYQYFGWNMSGVKYVSSEELPPLPDLGAKLDSKFLTQYYFEEINPLFAILHETVFKEQIVAYEKVLRDQIMLHKDDHDSKGNQTRLFSAMLYLVYALAIRFSEILKPKNPSIEMLQLEEKLFKYGYKVISILSFEWESFELIQGWLLITLYLRVTHRQTSCSHALGQAMDMVKSMGLGFAHDNAKFYSSTAYERLKAKRIFWCVFTFDRVFGLQTGRYCGIRDEDFNNEFPSYDFKHETEKDDWLTLPALGLIHIARVSNFVHTAATDNPHLIKYQQVNAELVKLHEWFNANGFRNDLFFNKKNDSSSLVKAQVKLHYYDLVLCIHSKILFNYIGRRIASHGLKVEMVIDACNGVIEVLDKTNKAGLLYTPWYSVLLLLFNVGVNAITLINGGAFVEQAREVLKNAMRLLTILRKSPIRNEQNKLVFRERFKMVRECIWALKMANRILTLRLQEDIGVLNSIGVDHGSSDVNKQTFTQLGIASESVEGKSTQPKTNEFNQVFEKHLHRSSEIRQLITNDVDSPVSVNSDSTSNVQSIEPVDTYSSAEIDNLLGNIQWFDQWTDFNIDF